MEWDMNVGWCTEIYGKPSNRCQDVSFKTTNHFVTMHHLGTMNLYQIL